jgi:hypothetical protein
MLRAFRLLPRRAPFSQDDQSFAPKSSANRKSKTANRKFISTPSPSSDGHHQEDGNQ